MSTLESAPRQLSAGSRSCRRSYGRFRRQLSRLLEISQRPEPLLSFPAPAVSRWTIAQHLDHLARSNRYSLAAIRHIASPRSDPRDAEDGLTLVGRAVLFTGWIPRGRGRAPERTLPQAGSLTEIRGSLRELQTAVAELEGHLGDVTAARGRIRHHVFGGMTAAQWLRFMAVHTHHHLKIIRELERTAGADPAYAGET